MKVFPYPVYNIWFANQERVYGRPGVVTCGVYYYGEDRRGGLQYLHMMPEFGSAVIPLDLQPYDARTTRGSIVQPRGRP